MATIDEKVVELKLDDRQFDKASDKTISKLEELKKSLNFDGAVKSFKEIDKAAKEVDLTPMEKGVQAVGKQFDALATIAEAALWRITNKAMNWGENMVKSLTIDQISSGWDKYADKTAAVQTIMAATAKEFGNVDNQMELVEEQLESLNWFTDETSYKFLDMVNNIGKFTSNSVKLETSVRAMQGISTWAARSGADVNEAGRAMYNLAQAISVGAVKLMDWKSIENANMATAEFKETAIQTAEAMGTLTRMSDDTWKTLAGHEVSIKNFNENLSDAWFTSEVLLATLDKYGGFATELNKLVEATDMETASLISMIDEYVDGTLDMEEAMTMTGLSAEDLTEWLEKLGSEEMKLGREAFKAAQESKTFADVVGYVKEAVGSGWMRTFEYIFGNYEEAKELWSELAEAMYGVFVASGDMRNGILKDWKLMGGRTYLIDGVRKVFTNIGEVVGALKETFRDIFPQIDADTLLQLTYNFNKMADSFRLNQQSIEALQNTLRPFLELLKGLWETAKVIVKAFEPVYILINQLAGAALYLTGELGKLASSLLGITFSTDSLETLYTVLNTIAKILTGTVYLGINLVIQGISDLLTFVGKVKATFQQGEGGIRGFINAIVVNLQEAFVSIANGEGVVGKTVTTIIGIATKLGDALKNIFDTVKSMFTEGGSINDIFSSMADGISDSGILNILGGIALALATIVKNIFDTIASLGDAESDLRMVINNIIGAFKVLWDWLTEQLSQMTFRDVADVILVLGLANLIMGFSNFTKSLTNIGNALRTQVTNIGNSFNALINTLSGNGASNGVQKLTDSLKGLASATKYAQMALAVYTMVWAISKLAELDPEDLTRASIVLAGTFTALIILFKVLDKLHSGSGGGGVDNGPSGIQKAADTIIKFATAVSVLAAAMYMLAHLQWGEIAKGGVALLGILAALAGFMAVMHKFKIAGSGMKKIGLTILPVALGIASLAAPVAIFGQIPFDNLISGLGAVITLLTGVALALVVMNKATESAGQMLAAAAAFDLMAVALTAMVIPVSALSLLSQQGLGAALATLILLIGTLAISLAGLATLNVANILSAAGAITLAAGALSMLAVAVGTLSILNLPSLILGLGSLILTLTAMVGLAALVGNFAPLAAGLAVLSGALLSLAAVILSVGASFALFGWGVKQLAEAVAIITGLAVGIGAAGAMIGEDFPETLNRGLDIVMMVLHAFLQRIPELTYDLAAATVGFLSGILFGILEIAPDIVKGFLWIVTLLLDAIASLAEPLINALTKLIDGLTASVPDLMYSFSKFVDAFMKSAGNLLWNAIISTLQGIANSLNLGFLSDWLEDFHTWGEDAVDEMKTGMVDGMDNSLEEIDAKAQEVGGTADTGVKMGASAEDGKEAAKNYTSGYIGGFDAALKDAFAAGARVGNKSVEGLASKDGIDAHSPSWLTRLLGINFDEGLGEGILSMLPESFEWGAMLGDSAGNGLFSALSDGLIDIESLLSAFFGRDSVAEQTRKTHAAIRGGLSKADAKEMQAKGGVKKTANETGTETGEAYNEGFASALSSDKTSSGGSVSSAAKEQVKTVAEAVKESYSEELEHLEADAKTEDLQFNLWESLNVNVSDVEKKAKKIEYTNRKITFQIERMRIAGEKYEQILEGMGEDAIETKEAYNEWLQEQIDLEELQNELYDLQNEVIDKNSELLKKIEQGEKESSQAYKLWTAMNSDATDAQKSAAELANLNNELDTQVQKTRVYASQYQEAVAQYGPNSQEAINAYNTYVDSLTSVVEKQNEITAKQKENIQDQSQAFRDYAAIMHEMDVQDREYAARADILANVEQAQRNYNNAVKEYGETSKQARWALDELNQAQERLNLNQERGGNQMSLRESLLQQGFSQQEVEDYFKDQAGIQTRAAEEVIDLSLETLLKQVGEQNEMFVDLLVTNLGDSTLAMAEVGKGYTLAIGEGMTSTSNLLNQDATSVVTDAIDVVANDKTIAGNCEEVGYQLDMGFIKGIERGGYQVSEKLVEIVEAAIAAAKAAAGIQSPSRITKWMGSMLDLGLADGLEQDVYTVVKASQKVMDASLREMANVIHTDDNLEFVGRMIAGGIADGYSDYSSEILDVSTKLLAKLDQDVSDSIGDAVGYESLWAALGFDEDDLSYELVFDMDMSKAYEEMTDLEKAMAAYENLDDEARQSLAENLDPKSFEEWWDVVKDLEYWTGSGHHTQTPYTIEEKIYAATHGIELPKTWVPDMAKYANLSEEGRQRKYQEYLDKQAAELARSMETGVFSGIIEALKAGTGDSLATTRMEYIQNIYSTRPLSTLDVYRNTNKALAKFQ